jgi:hypothetical protein
MNKEDSMIILEIKEQPIRKHVHKSRSHISAPNCSGISKLLNVINAAVRTKNTIIVPCIVIRDK